MNKRETIEQTRLAFDFMQKLYFEVSYLIKEIQGLLGEEEEKFIIGRPSGYGVTARSSTGLETNYVSLWPLRKLAVFFVPEARTQVKGGTTTTRFEDNKVIYIRVVLDEKNLAEPLVYSGVLYDFEKKSAPGKSHTKFEHLMALLEYNDSKVFHSPEQIDYEDANIKFSGKLFTTSLFDITDSEQIAKRIIEPTLELFRGIP